MRLFEHSKIILTFLISLVFLSFWAIENIAFSMELLADKALAEVDAKAGPVTISIEQDTVRIFLDTYIETYAEIDQVRLGYYYKDRADLVTRKGMNPGTHLDGDRDPRISVGNKMDGHQQFQVDYAQYAGTDGERGVLSPIRYAMEYELVKNGVREMEYVPWTDDDLYMAKYKNKATIKMWVDGVQGDNRKISNFSQSTYQNRNYLDWDINLNNVRLGASPDNPLKINGLVVRLKYSNIHNDDKLPQRKLTDIIIGTNDVQGDFMGDLRRVTGLYSPKNAYRSRQMGLLGILQGSSDLALEFNSTPVPVILQRDSMLMLVDHFYFGRDYRVPTGEAFMAAVPDNPTSTNDHSGVFLRIGLDRDSPHFGFQLITGYNELVASSFQYRGEHLNESLYKWWHGEPHADETRTYPKYLPQTDFYSDTTEL